MSHSDPGKPEIPLKKPAADEYGPASMQAQATRLMTAAKRGDQRAFDELVEALRGRAFTIARSLVGSREEAMDLSQEAFLKTYRARETFRDGDPFLPWFHRILRNTCFSYLRKQKRLKKHSLSAPDSENSAGSWDIVDEAAPAPSERLERSERVDAFWIAMGELSARDREILSLRHFEELAYQEIADALEVPIGTVMSRLFHARRRLRDLLAKHLEDSTLISLEKQRSGSHAPAADRGRRRHPRTRKGDSL